MSQQLTFVERTPQYRLLRFLNDHIIDMNITIDVLEVTMQMPKSDFFELLDDYSLRGYISQEGRNPNCFRITNDGQAKLTELQRDLDYERSVSASQKANENTEKALDYTKASQITSIINAVVASITAIIATCAIVQQCNQGSRQNELLEEQNKQNMIVPANKSSQPVVEINCSSSHVRIDSAKQSEPPKLKKDSVLKKGQPPTKKVLKK